MTWKVREPYRIELVDAAELRDESPELAFSLGVEWAMARVALVVGRVQWPMLVHAENARRIELLGRKYGVATYVEPVDGVTAEGEVAMVYLRPFPPAPAEAPA